METNSRKIHAVLLSSPGMGHLIPLVELGKRLGGDHGWDVTVFALAAGGSRGDSDLLTDSLTNNTKQVKIVELTPPDISNLIGPDAAVVTLLAVMMRAAVPTLRSALAAMEATPDVLIVDFFGVDHLEIGKELGIPSYVYVASNAWFLAFLVYSPILDKEVEGEYVDRFEPLNIPGCHPLRPADVPDPMLDRSNQQYSEFVRLGEKTPHGDGVLLNIWEEFQPKTLAALRDQDLLGRIIGGPIYAIGPLVRSNTMESPSGDEVFDWLDKQPRESVLYISFGSGGTLSADQLTEMAWGLELSGQRFIWVIRPPTSTTGAGSYLRNTNASGDFSSMLPEGFLSRTQGVGFLIPMWAPQVDILRHPSVGGFLSHCGWSSTLESITNGVPMVAWPLYAEQRMNAALLTDEVGVSVQPRELPTKGTIGREEIKTLVMTIMTEEEGRAIRAKAKEVKKSAEKALTSTSQETLSRFIEACKSRRVGGSPSPNSDRPIELLSQSLHPS